jgi:hypothetical protein
MSSQIKYEIKRAGLLYYFRLISKDILTSSNDKKMNFLEMFQDYEEYHKEINTGKKFRRIN